MQLMLANAAAASASSEGGTPPGAATGPPPNSYNPLNPAGSRRNSLNSNGLPGGGNAIPSGRRTSGSGAGTGAAGAMVQDTGSGGGGAAAPSANDTAVLTQIAIAMQNDPSLATQLRAIVGSGEGGGQGAQAV